MRTPGVIMASNSSMKSLDSFQIGEESLKLVKPGFATSTSSATNHGNVREEIETFEATQMPMSCLKCDNYIDLECLQHHRAFHDALSLFRYKMETKPSDEQTLNRQRATLVKELNKLMNVIGPAYQKQLAKIDLAYEIIKSDMYGRTNKAKSMFNSSDHADVILKSSKTNLSGGAALGVCQSANEKWKSVMEDAYSYEAEYMHGRNSGFFAIFDGYSGQTAANKCAEQFHLLLKEKLSKISVSKELCSSGECKLSACFKETYDEIDKQLLLGDDETSRNRWSGCSATTCVIDGRRLHVANVGNVKGVLVKGNGAVWALTEDHTPKNKKEKHRIKLNGDVHRWSKTALVNGVTMTTRGLGNHGDPNLKLNVINTPACSCVLLNEDDWIIILGSGGLWEVFDEDEFSVLVQHWFKEKINKSLRKCDDSNQKKGEIIPSEGLIRISIHGGLVHDMQAESVGLDQGANRSTLLLNNSELDKPDKQNYERHPPLEEKECHDCDNNITGLAGEDIQDSLTNLERKDRADCHNESVKTNQSFAEKPCEKLCYDDLTRQLIFERPISYFLKDLSLPDSCLIAHELSKYFVQAALNGGAKDNLTVMVVLFSR